jgi:hypothetical protein
MLKNLKAAMTQSLYWIWIGLALSVGNWLFEKILVLAARLAK